MTSRWRAIALAAIIGTVLPDSVLAQQVKPGTGSVVETVLKLRPGEFVWQAELAPAGPLLLIVNTTTQRAIVYRNGIPIAATTVSTGRPGYSTPIGVFTILQKHVEHYSSKYDNAPMPFMQRLTWYGVALHAGFLPGYPASHGCIRLPKEFARRLYEVTRLGMTVVVTDVATTPRIAPTPEIALGRSRPFQPDARFDWHPEKSPAGPVSIIVSIKDGRAIVLRNGVEIGSAPVAVEGPTQGTWAYARRDVGGKQQWIRMDLAADATAATPVAQTEWQRFRASPEFRVAVAQVIGPETTIIVTSDSLQQEAPAPSSVLEGDDK